MNLEWDAWNQLVAVLKGNHRYEFVYDASGRRVIMRDYSKGELDAEDYLVWDGLTIAEMRNGYEGVKKQYFANGLINHPYAGSEKLFYTKDHLGSVRQAINENGQLVASFDYDAYGNVTRSGMGSTPYVIDNLYTGHFYHQDTGLYLAPFRAYDPVAGRWLSREPLGLDGPNLYHYGFANPLNTSDPTGLTVDVIGGTPAQQNEIRNAIRGLQFGKIGTSMIRIKNRRAGGLRTA